MLDDIALFVQIVRQQGLAATARKLDIPAATVTRRLQRLEQQLQCQLLHRNARRFMLTAEGEVWYQAYADLVEQMENTHRNLSREMDEMSGPLRVLAPTNISNGLLQPMWSGFMKQYPAIRLELMLNNQTEDMLQLRADIALRIGPQADSQLYQQRLGSIETGLFAAPSYLQEAGIPDTPDTLLAHRLIGNNAIHRWSLQHRSRKQQKTLHPTFASWSSDIAFNTQLVRDGLGIALLPVSETLHYEASGQLQRILCDWHGEQRDLYAIWPGGKLLNARARCLRDYMARQIPQHLPLP